MIFLLMFFVLGTFIDVRPPQSAAFAKNSFQSFSANMNRAQFIRGGNATFTITSKATGKRFTYRVRRPKADPTAPLFASLLTGPDNETSYTYIGIVSETGLRATRGSKVSTDAPGFRALEWFIRHLDTDQVDMCHEGRCGRCGRKLTVPESVASGFGPECLGKTG